MNVTRTSKTAASDGAGQEPAAPDPKAVEAIGRALEAYYADLIEAPLPDKFMELLARLEAGGRPADPQGKRDAHD